VLADDQVGKSLHARSLIGPSTLRRCLASMARVAGSGIGGLTAK
jgi:hypothetical protein